MSDRMKCKCIPRHCQEPHETRTQSDGSVECRRCNVGIDIGCVSCLKIFSNVDRDRLADPQLFSQVLTRAAIIAEKFGPLILRVAEGFMCVRHSQGLDNQGLNESEKGAFESKLRTHRLHVKAIHGDGSDWSICSTCAELARDKMRFEQRRSAAVQFAYAGR